MEKRKFAFISLTIQDRVISLKFSSGRVSKRCTIGNFQKIFLSPKMAAILNFRIFTKNGKTQICLYLLNRARYIDFVKIFDPQDILRNILFIALIHPSQWTIANPVGIDRPAKRQKKMPCVSTGWPVPVLCIRLVVHGIYFLSRQHDVLSSFSFGPCTVQTCFSTSPEFLKEKVCIMTDFQPYSLV